MVAWFQVRRPVGRVVKDIGAWQDIIEMISVLAVIANGFLIAFTSEFIPKFVYYTKHKSMATYYQDILRKANATIGSVKLGELI